MNLKVLNRQGMSIRAISRLTGLSRTTVRKVLSQPVPKVYGPRRTRPTKIDPFADYLTEQIELRPWVRASTLYHEIEATGYTGHYEAVKVWARGHRTQKAAERRATVRFETRPGVEAQFDWKGHLTGLLENAPEQKVWIFRLVLGYSRHRFTRAVTSMRLPLVLADLQDIFFQIGGVAQRIVFDNFKAAVERPRPDLRLNPAFASFCAHYGTEPAPAIVYSPERKGKVERSFLDLENSELLRQLYPSLEALQQALDQDDAAHAQRLHTSTGQTPADRLERERPFLIPLPKVAFDPRIPETRKVLSDCTISYGAAFYSVPHQYVGKQVTVKANLRRPIIDIFDADQQIASHQMVARGERAIIDDHIAELRRPRFDRVRNRRPAQAPTPSQAVAPQLVRWPVVEVETRSITAYVRAIEEGR